MGADYYATSTNCSYTLSPSHYKGAVQYMHITVMSYVCALIRLISKFYRVCLVVDIEFTSLACALLLLESMFLFAAGLFTFFVPIWFENASDWQANVYPRGRYHSTTVQSSFLPAQLETRQIHVVQFESNVQKLCPEIY